MFLNCFVLIAYVNIQPFLKPANIFQEKVKFFLGGVAG